jgi:hypothetical protein
MRLLQVGILATLAAGIAVTSSAAAVPGKNIICGRLRSGTGGTYASLSDCARNIIGTGAWDRISTGNVLVLTSQTSSIVLVAGAKTITCTAQSSDADVTAGGDSGTVTKITLTGCSTSQAGCLVKTEGDANGTILVPSFPTLTIEGENSGKAKVPAVEYKSNATTKSLVTLKFEADAGKSCSEFGTETKVKGSVIAEADNETEELIFPSPEMKGNTLEAFGVAAKLFGSVKQTVDPSSLYDLMDIDLEP